MLKAAGVAGRRWSVRRSDSLWIGTTEGGTRRAGGSTESDVRSSVVSSVENEGSLRRGSTNAKTRLYDTLAELTDVDYTSLLTDLRFVLE